MSLPLTLTLYNISGEFNGRCNIQVVKILFRCPQFGLSGYKRNAVVFWNILGLGLGLGPGLGLKSGLKK